uniref:Uncharacterized protein n=1 Tax=Strombidinopsis acuminata TaxID=141414 RepID=A0A7S3TEG7_9SPIT|mmetsp:Transcript_63443/g.87652  ORF Transcript_63443/g.87652 Transcript_63443/m.87652 type:complete len:186 (+) Transcript_63443:361-918(+)
MLKERRDWIQDYRAIHGGKPPADITKFYERLNVEEPLSPEEEEKKRLEDEEKAKEKEKKKKDKKKAKKKKKKKDDSEKGPAVAKFGPTEVIQRFDEQYDNFANVWADRSELNNFDQRFDDHMARNEVMPLVEKQHQAQVDDMIKLELANMAILAGIKTKKKKKGKKKKKKKKKENGDSGSDCSSY